MIASISVTAFADSALTLNKINLKPAVDQANKLYNSLSWLGGSKTIVGLFNGFSTNYKTLLENSKAARDALNTLLSQDVLPTKDDETTGKKVVNVDDSTFFSTSGLNYTIACVWNNLANAWVGTVVNPVNEANVKAAAGTVTGAIANKELGVLNSMPAVPAEFTVPTI